MTLSMPRTSAKDARPLEASITAVRDLGDRRVVVRVVCRGGPYPSGKTPAVYWPVYAELPGVAGQVQLAPIEVVRLGIQWRFRSTDSDPMYWASLRSALRDTPLSPVDPMIKEFFR